MGAGLSTARGPRLLRPADTERRIVIWGVQFPGRDALPVVKFARMDGSRGQFPGERRRRPPHPMVLAGERLRTVRR